MYRSTRYFESTIVLTSFEASVAICLGSGLSPDRFEMSTRGRGYISRAGYGGRGGGGYTSYRGGGSSYRGGGGGGGRSGPYTERGGRGSYYSGGSERYNSGGDRYSSGRNERSEDMSFKKPYRSEMSSSYGGRDHMGKSGSPDRKRMRMEESGGRRSHEGNHYGSRHESYSNERRVYIEQRRSSSRDNSYRKSTMGISSPRSPPSVRSRGISRGRSSAPVRRSFRGRTMRTMRGSFRGTARIRSYSSKVAFSSRSFNPVRKPSTKVRSTPKTKRGSASSSDADENWEETEEKKPIKEEKAEAPAKSPVKNEPGAEEEATDKEAVDAVSADEQEPLPRSKVTGKSFIRLTCPHCREKYLTFKLYARHLQSSKHRYVMDDVASKLKFMLLRMRTVQRNAQRALEENGSVELSEVAAFCPICKLNHRTSKQEHYRSECHRNIKKFLTPYCRICQTALRTPMLFEHHICSLEHIKMRARSEMLTKAKAKKSGSGDEGMDVDLDNFMTLDSVGDVDEVEDEDSGAEKKNEDGTEKTKTTINVGSDHIKKVEVFYCGLCKSYLPQGEDDTVLKDHCRMRGHLSRYVRFRDDRALRRQAERIHRIHQQAKEIKQEAKDASKDAEANTTGTDTAAAAPKASKPKENGGAEDAAEEGTDGDEKLWNDDVDKEIGDLLRDVGQTDSKYSDDEEDSIVGRYDRFRKSDKKSEVDAAAADLSKSDTSTTVKSEESTAAPVEEVAAKQ